MGKRITLTENAFLHTDGSRGVSFDSGFGKVSITARSRAFKDRFASAKSDVVEVRIKKDGITSCYRKSVQTPEMARDLMDHLVETAKQGRLDLFLMDIKRLGLQAVAFVKKDWEEDIFRDGSAVATWSFSKGGSSTGIVSKPIGTIFGNFCG